MERRQHFSDPYTLAREWALHDAQGDYGKPDCKCTISGRTRRTLHTCGDAVYSYGMKLAHVEYRRDVDTVHPYVMLDYVSRFHSNGRGYTPTTTRHLIGLEQALEVNGDWFTSVGTYGGYRLSHGTRYHSALANIAYEDAHPDAHPDATHA